MELHDSTYALGCTESPFSCEQDLAIFEKFFLAFDSEEYVLELKATNGQNAIGHFILQITQALGQSYLGRTQMSFYTNKAPINGHCSLTSNGTNQLRWIL